MRRIVLALFAAVFVASFLVGADCRAQRGAQWGAGWRAEDAYYRQYNIATLDTMSGEVVKKERFFVGNGLSPGIHIVVKNESETISVHLGPTWFVESQDEVIEVGDMVEVFGSRIIYRGDPAIIAAQVTRGDLVLQLRDEQGYPAWSGWRRGRWP